MIKATIEMTKAQIAKIKFVLSWALVSDPDPESGVPSAPLLDMAPTMSQLDSFSEQVDVMMKGEDEE